MIESLITVNKNSKIYVLCMDNFCYRILKNENINNVILISLHEFESKDLLLVKEKRTRAEYCWTCTAMLIKFVLDKYKENHCTYIDVDMKFYSDPNVLLKEMYDNNCFVLTVPHRFAPDKRRSKREQSSGRNCVQFNTFTNTVEGLRILDDWISCCIKECSLRNGGDQKYTDKWIDNPHVNISHNVGAGIAPWNINRYKSKELEAYIVTDIYEKKDAKIVFYHFQNLVFPVEGIARVIPYLEYWTLDESLVDFIYKDYLKDLYNKKEYLQKTYDYRCNIRQYVSEDIKNSIPFMERLKKWINISFEDKVESINYKVRCILRCKKSKYEFGNKG